MAGITPEGRVKKRVRQLLSDRGARLWHYMPMQNGMGVVGIPDLVCCYRGIFVAIETKAPMKTPTTEVQRWNKATPNQQHQLTGIRRAGGYAIVADDVEQVRQLLDKIDVTLGGPLDG